jgi:hypothetical protein
VNLEVNNGLGVMMLCQSKFTNHSECTGLLGDVGNGEGSHECVCVAGGNRKHIL